MFILADFLLHRLDAAFQLRSVVNMDMPDIAFRGKVISLGLTVIFMVVDIRIVPLTELAQRLILDFLLLPHEVSSLIETDNHMKQVLHPGSGPADRRHHRHAQQLREFLDIELVSAAFQRIKHIQCHHHAHIHVNQLGRQIQVPFQVSRIHHIDNHIGRLFNDMLAHIQFLGTVGRKRVCARQVYQPEAVPLIVEKTFFGIHRHPAIVAHMLMRARSNIKKRRLSAVRVSHQGHINNPPLVEGERFHLIRNRYGFRDRAW